MLLASSLELLPGTKFILECKQSSKEGPDQQPGEAHGRREVRQHVGRNAIHGVVCSAALRRLLVVPGQQNEWRIPTPNETKRKF